MTKRMRQTDVWPQGKFGRPNRKHKKSIDTGATKSKQTQKKADARTDRKQHALQETKLDGNLGEASATLDQGH